MNPWEMWLAQRQKMAQPGPNVAANAAKDIGMIATDPMTYAPPVVNLAVDPDMVADQGRVFARGLGGIADLLATSLADPEAGQRASSMLLRKLSAEGARQFQQHPVYAMGMALGLGALKVPRASNLLPEQAVVQERVARRVEANPDHYVRRYLRKNGNVVNPDLAKLLFPDYARNNATKALHAPSVHEASSAVSKAALDALLSQPPRSGLALLMAGGPGAGKSSALRGVPALRDVIPNADVVIDGTLASQRSAVATVNKILGSGRKAHIAMVYRDPVEAYRRTLARAKREGRAVPYDYAAWAHQQMPGSMLALAQLFADQIREGKVTIDVIDNSGPPGTAAVVGNPRLFLESQPYLNREGYFHEPFRQALEVARLTGEIDESTYLGAGGTLAAPEQPVPRQPRRSAE